MVHYEPVKVTINAPGLINIVWDVVVRHHDFFDSILFDRDLLFISKFWSLLYYFLNIKKKLSIVFFLQTDK